MISHLTWAASQLFLFAATDPPPEVDSTGSALCQGAGGELKGGTLANPACSAHPASHFTAHIADITNTLLYIAGAIAIIVLIVGGLRYITSQGDSTALKQAKDTILYAIIGLVVVIMAFAIVHFVNGRF